MWGCAYGRRFPQASHIMEYLDVRMIIWRNGIFEGSIKGSFSLAEAKEIINSIYGE